MTEVLHEVLDIRTRQTSQRLKRQRRILPPPFSLLSSPYLNPAHLSDTCSSDSDGCSSDFVSSYFLSRTLYLGEVEVLRDDGDVGRGGRSEENSSDFSQLVRVA